MKTRELIVFLKEWANNVGIIPVDLILKHFSKEKKESVLSELSRMDREGIITRVIKGFYVNPFSQKNEEELATEVLQRLRPFDQLYLSLEARAFELNMITQAPNRLTFVTDGRSYTIRTLFGTIELVHQKSVDVYTDKDITYDKKRGIYVANRNKVINDAVIHRRKWLLDLIEESSREDDRIRHQQAKTIRRQIS